MSNKATFHDDVTIEFSALAHEGYGSIDVEVEFTATRYVRATWEQPAEGDEREIVKVRPFVRKKTSLGFKSTEREYLETPAWLTETLTGCIDPSELHVDWREYDEAREYERAD